LRYFAQGADKKEKSHHKSGAKMPKTKKPQYSLASHDSDLSAKKSYNLFDRRRFLDGVWSLRVTGGYKQRDDAMDRQ
jgi:hypothetical protein